MFDIFKNFFQKKQVILFEGGIIALAAIGLAIAGFNATEDVTGIASKAVSSLAAIESLVTIIQGISKK